MKKILLVSFLVLFTSNLSADVSNNISQYISNLIPGEGDTEVSIDLRENNKPDYSILTVREIEKTENGNFFSQLSLFNTEKDNDERIVANIGLGKRSLSQDNTLMTGFNVFLDYDDAGNLRSSFGLEARSAVLEFMYNYYFGLDDASDEKVLDGYELGLASQIPYLHWADVFINTYEWEGVSRDDVKGTKIGSELLLSPTLNLEIAYDDKDKKGLEDEWYAKIMFVHPPRNKNSLQDGFISENTWRSQKDMSGQLLTKVKRNNKIFVEFNGKSTISRAD